LAESRGVRSQRLVSLERGENALDKGISPQTGRIALADVENDCGLNCIGKGSVYNWQNVVVYNNGFLT